MNEPVKFPVFVVMRNGHIMPPGIHLHRANAEATAAREEGEVIPLVASPPAAQEQKPVALAEIYAAIEAEPELEDEPPEEMMAWLSNAKPDEIMEAMRVTVRETKKGIRERIAYLHVASPIPAEGWVKCSERMPTDAEMPVTVFDGQKQWSAWALGELAVKNYGITHWKKQGPNPDGTVPVSKCTAAPGGDEVSAIK